MIVSIYSRQTKVGSDRANLQYGVIYILAGKECAPSYKQESEDATEQDAASEQPFGEKRGIRN
jgi:hypothetical protein